MSEYRKYQRTQVAEIAEWTPGFDMTDVSISEADRKAGSPKIGDGIARNPDNHEDRWLIAADYRAKNFAPVVTPDANIERIVERAIDEGQRCIIDNTGQAIARRAAELAVAEERERCAKAAENEHGHWYRLSMDSIKRIRESGTQTARATTDYHAGATRASINIAAAIRKGDAE